MNYNFKVKSIYFLFAVAIFLVAAIIVLKYSGIQNKGKRGEHPQPKKEINAEIITRNFYKAFENWGFENNWIKTINVDKNKNIVDKIYRIKIPKEIPIDFILLEFNLLFENFSPLKIIAKDLPLKHKTEIKFYLNDNLLLLAYAKKVKNIRRKKIPVALIYDKRNNNKFNIEKNKFFVKTFLVPITSENLDFIKEIARENYDFIPLIDDEISEYKYSLDADLSKSELKNSVRRILADFGTSKIYFYDANSELCSSIHFEFVKKLFASKTNIYNKNIATDLTDKTNKELETAFKLLLLVKKPKLFLINEEQFVLNREFFISQWKKGVRFLTAGKLMEYSLN